MIVERERLYIEEPFEGFRASLALRLFDIGVVQFKPLQPFRLKLHDNYPEAPKSPLYLDFRQLLRDYCAKKNAIDVYEEIFQDFDFNPETDLLAPVPTAATPLASSLQDRLGAGMIVPRKNQKTHGIETEIDGWLIGDENKHVVVIEDAVSQANSSLEVVEHLRRNKYIVKDVACLIYRELFGKEKLEQAGCRLHYAMTVTQLLNFGRSEERIDEGLLTATLLGMQGQQEYLKHHT